MDKSVRFAWSHSVSESLAYSFCVFPSSIWLFGIFLSSPRVSLFPCSSVFSVLCLFGGSLQTLPSEAVGFQVGQNKRKLNGRATYPWPLKRTPPPSRHAHRPGQNVPHTHTDHPAHFASNTHEFKKSQKNIIHGIFLKPLAKWLLANSTFYIRNQVCKCKIMK